MYIKNNEILEQYLNECITTKSEIRQKAKYADSLRAQIEANIIKREYGVGGTGIHRGFYSPSIAFDIVMGNVSRGRLLKSGNHPKKYDYEFCFDVSDQLSCIRSFRQNKIESTEYLFHSDSCREGYTFLSESCPLYSYSKETFQHSHLISYELFYFSPSPFPVLLYQKEQYTYIGNDSLRYDRFDFCPDFSSVSKCSLQHLLFQFELDGNGNLSSFRTGNDNGELNERIFTVNIQRKA